MPRKIGASLDSAVDFLDLGLAQPCVEMLDQIEHGRALVRRTLTVGRSHLNNQTLISTQSAAQQVFHRLTMECIQRADVDIHW